MKDYINTNDPSMNDIVGRCNERLNRWRDYLSLKHHYGEDRDKQLVLYIDQESAYEHRMVDCGPLQIGYTMAPRENDTILFGHQLRLIEVLVRDGRYDHLCYV